MTTSSSTGDESDVLLARLMKAAEFGERTGNLDLAAMALHLADLIIDKWCPRETMMIEVPEDYVSTSEQAHALGLVTPWETMKLLDLTIADLAEAVRGGLIETAVRCNNTPCFSLQAIDAYKLTRHAEAG